MPYFGREVTNVYFHEHVVTLYQLAHVSALVAPSQKLTFSSPIVNFPCVCSLFSANDCNFFTGSVFRTVIRNLTFCFVYSWPGFAGQQGCPQGSKRGTYIYFGVVWQSSKGLIQRCVHFCWGALEKAHTTCTKRSALEKSGYGNKSDLR